MPKRTIEPVTGFDPEERAVMLAALSAFEVAHVYSAELESKDTAAGRKRRLALFADARIAGRLCERLLL